MFWQIIKNRERENWMNGTRATFLSPSLSNCEGVPIPIPLFFLLTPSPSFPSLIDSQSHHTSAASQNYRFSLSLLLSFSLPFSLSFSLSLYSFRNSLLVSFQIVSSVTILQLRANTNLPSCNILLSYNFLSSLFYFFFHANEKNIHTTGTEWMIPPWFEVRQRWWQPSPPFTVKEWEGWTCDDPEQTRRFGDDEFFFIVVFFWFIVESKWFREPAEEGKEAEEEGRETEEEDCDCFWFKRSTLAAARSSFAVTSVKLREFELLFLPLFPFDPFDLLCEEEEELRALYGWHFRFRFFLLLVVLTLAVGLLLGSNRGDEVDDEMILAGFVFIIGLLFKSPEAEVTSIVGKKVWTEFTFPESEFLRFLFRKVLQFLIQKVTSIFWNYLQRFDSRQLGTLNQKLKEQVEGGS